MAWENGFYNSVNGDRTYNADQLSSIFTGLITNGVYESVANKLAVQPNSNMTIQIATGRGWFNGRWVNNTSEYLMTLEASDVILNRYAAVVIKVDNSTEVRSATPYIKYSEYATTPTKPTMDRGDEVNEYCLAYVYIRAGATEITAADIQDSRGNTDVCGWVTGLIEQVDTTTLLDQYEAIYSDYYNIMSGSFNSFLTESEEAFDTWFSGLQDTLDENTEAMLVAALPTSLTATLTADGWTQSGNIYTQSVLVTGMTATKSVLVSPNSSSLEDYEKSGVKAVSQSTNTLVFNATSIPENNLTVDIIHMGR